MLVSKEIMSLFSLTVVYTLGSNMFSPHIPPEPEPNGPRPLADLTCRNPEVGQNTYAHHAPLLGP